jgi:transcriptional regulator with XRE-family HTH domain
MTALDTTPTEQLAPVILRAIAAARAGEAIKQTRVARGLTQDECARRAGLYRPTLSAIENGHLEAWPRWRQQIARALNCSEAELFPELQEQA